MSSAPLDPAAPSSSRGPRTRDRTTEALPPSRLWTSFVLAWLSVFAISAVLLWQSDLARVRVVPGLLGVGALAGVYLWLTLRAALAPSDLSPSGPPAFVLRRRLGPLAAMSLMVVGLVVLMPQGGLWWLLQHAVIAAGLALPPLWAVWTTSALVLLSLVCAWLASGKLELMLLIQVAFGAAAIAIRQLTIAVGQLRSAREELARLAVAEERLRFARDLHDLLGHSLSLIVLKSELARRLLPVEPERAALEVADVERAARDALREVRTTVAGYRQPALERELAAARDLLTAAGVQATISEPEELLPQPVDGLLAWTVREGVTNVIRHSRARACAIRVECEGQLARVIITDDGPSARREAGSVHGSGLTGLAERAAAQGGRIQYGPEPRGGFRLLVEAQVTGGPGGAP